MNEECISCLKRVAARHGAGFVIRAVQRAAEAQLRDIQFSLGCEERIAEQSEPYEATCSELSKL